MRSQEKKIKSGTDTTDLICSLSIYSCKVYGLKRDKILMRTHRRRSRLGKKWMESELRWKQEDDYKGTRWGSGKEVELTEIGCHLDVRDQERESWRSSTWLAGDAIILIVWKTAERVSEE